MRARRLAGLFLFGTVMHVVTVGAELPCTSHEPVSPQSAEHQHHAPTPAKQNDAPCHTPDVTATCQIMVSCGVDVSDVTRTSAAATTDDAIRVGAAERIPRFRLSGPEPPPPKI